MIYKMNIFSYYLSLNIAYLVGFSTCIIIFKIAHIQEIPSICFNKDDIVPLLNENNITII